MTKTFILALLIYGNERVPEFYEMQPLACAAFLQALEDGHDPRVEREDGTQSMPAAGAACIEVPG